MKVTSDALAAKKVALDAKNAAALALLAANKVTVVGNDTTV